MGRAQRLWPFHAALAKTRAMLATLHHPAATPTDAPPLVIAHGLYGSGRNWGVIARRLADIRNVVAVDMRNHGESPRLPSHSYPDLASDLAEVTQGLEATEPDGLPSVLPLRAIAPPEPGRPTALLITDEDCRVEDFDLAALDIRAAWTLEASHLRSAGPVGDPVVQFERAALADAAGRAGFAAQAMRAGVPPDLAAWAARAGVAQLVTPYVPQGPLRDWLEAATPALSARGITLTEWRRDWDSAIWPHARAGFFKVKQQIPRILADTRTV